MSEEIELLKNVAGRLESAGIAYMITGSIAMAFFSTPRMTRDIDIIVQAGSSDVDKIFGLFEDEFYIEKETVRSAILNRGMFNIIHNESIIKVDVIIRKDGTYRKEEFSRRLKIPVEGVPISVVTPEDLILSKLVWAKQSQSELQIRDVQQMTAVLKKPDFKYIEKWSKILGVDDMLQRVIRSD